MNNAEYWKQRFGQLERSRHISNGDKYREIERLFSKSQQALEAKINAWYGRFAVNNGVSLEEAHKMLSNSELTELKWDINDYIKAGKENALNDRFRKQLENASAKYHISRLEALKLQSQMECERLYGNLTDTIDEHIKNQYADAYYRTAFEIERGTGIGKSLERINPDKIAQIVNKPWAVDQKNFAIRFGESKVKLINNVQNSLVRMCLAGGSPDTAIRELAKTMQGDKARASRIIMTESAYFAQNAQKQCFNALGVQEYEIVATLDSRTCSGACAGKDGEHYPMKMFQAGVTAPPFHPNCRCCTAPYFDDEWSKGERAARDEDGETYYVPSDMKYSEWKKAFVDGHTEELEPLSESLDYMGKPRIFDVDNIKVKAYEVDNSENVFTQTNSKDAQTTIKSVRTMQENGLIQDISNVIVAKDLRGVAAYDHANNRLFVNEKLSNESYIKSDVSNGYFVAETAEDVIMHEMFHKKHWDCIMTKGDGDAIMKQQMESELHKYVAQQQYYNKFYVEKNVSRNAARDFKLNDSLNELIADTLLLDVKGNTKDEYLLRLVKRCLE